MHIRTTLGFRCLLASRWNLLARHTKKVGESHPFGFRGCPSNSLGKDPANQSLCGQDKRTIRSGHRRVTVAWGHRPLSNPQSGLVGARGALLLRGVVERRHPPCVRVVQSAAAACRRVLGFDEGKGGESEQSKREGQDSGLGRERRSARGGRTARGGRN